MQAIHQNFVTQNHELGKLLGRIANGDQTAFAPFYEMSNEFVYRHLLRGLKNAAEIEETLSDVYLHVWRRGRSL